MTIALNGRKCETDLGGHLENKLLHRRGVKTATVIGEIIWNTIFLNHPPVAR